MGREIITKKAKTADEIFDRNCTIIGVSAIVLFAALVAWMIYDIVQCNIKYRVHGTVVEKFRTDAGYKSSPEAHVVMFSDSLKKNVDVRVSWNCYANTTVGERITFMLTKRQLQ